MNEWRPPRVRPPRARVLRGLAVAAVAVALLAGVSRTLGGSSVLPGDSRLRVVEATASPPAPPAPTPTLPPSPVPLVPASATWRELPAAPLAPRSGHVAEWAGDRMVVWGGAGYDREQGQARPIGDGAVLSGSSWSPLASPPLSARRDAAAVWMGRELFVWGGRDATGHRSDGAAYDPVTATWRSLPRAPLGPRSESTAVWDGERVVVVGGMDDDGAPRNVAAYDPAADAWSAVPALRQPAGQIGAVAVADGVVVWTDDRTAESPITPLRLDRGRSGWSALPALPPSVRRLAGIVEGGGTVHAVAEEWSPLVTRMLVLAPDERSWEQRAAVVGSLPGDSEVHWTGEAVLVTPSAGRATSLLYHQGRQGWASVEVGRDAVNAGGWSQTWTGRELLLWGGDGWIGGADPPSGRALRVHAGPVPAAVAPPVPQPAATSESSNHTTLPVGPTSAPQASARLSTSSIPRPVTASAP